MDARVEVGRQAGAQLRAESFLEQSVSQNIDQVTGFLRRQFSIFIVIVTCCLALGLVYLLTTPPSYTSHAMLQIDASKLRVLQQQQVPMAELPSDSTQVETQLEILKSEKIGLSVIKQLKLADDPEFAGSGAGLLSRLGDLVGKIEHPVEADATRTALASFLARRSVKRVKGTYIFDVGFTSLNAARSAAIANAIADAYIVDQLDAKYQATKRASAWMQDRIKELRRQVSDADRAVLEYKQKKKIVSVGWSPAGGGPRLLGEQQIEDLNTQLGTARAAAEEAKARLERINNVMQREVPDAAVADSLHSEVINRLRNNYLELAAKVGVWSARYGAYHLAVVNLRTQMAELRRSIHDELGRIAESYKSDFEISKTRLEGLQRELQELVATSEATNRDRLGLTDLESTAKVYHSIYDNFLQNYMEAIQQQSFPITDARVISEAASPRRKSGPLSILVLGVAGLVGIILSFGVAIVREAIDRVFRTTRDVESLLHVGCLAVLPRLASSSKSARRIASEVKPVPPGKPAAMPIERPPLFETIPGGRGNIGPASVSQIVALILNSDGSRRAPSCEISDDRKLRLPRDGNMRQVLDEPLSAFSEAVRSIKIAADSTATRNDSKVVGIVSTLPGEGKSTLASNLAELIAHTGRRIILLDADLRNPSLTRALAPQAKVGLLEILAGQAALDDVVCVNEQTGMSFIPTVIESHLVHTVEILASAMFERFIESLRNTYEYVVVDFPPLAPVVDVRATTRVVDSYIYVIEWGKARKSLVQQQLLAAPGIYDKLLGAVLNKSNLKQMQRYEDYGGHYYHKKYYGRYGCST